MPQPTLQEMRVILFQKDLMAFSQTLVPEVCICGTGWSGCAVLLCERARASLLVSDKALTTYSDCTLCTGCLYSTSALSLLQGPLKHCAGVPWISAPHICIDGWGQGLCSSASSLGKEKGGQLGKCCPPALQWSYRFLPNCGTICLHWSEMERWFLNLAHQCCSAGTQLSSNLPVRSPVGSSC